MIFSKKVEVVKTWFRSDNGQMWLARFAQSKQVLKKDRKRRNQWIRRSLLICGRRFYRSGILIRGRLWGRLIRCMMWCRNILASAISSVVSMLCPMSRVCRHERCVDLIVLAFPFFAVYFTSSARALWSYDGMKELIDDESSTKWIVSTDTATNWLLDQAHNMNTETINEAGV